MMSKKEIDEGMAEMHGTELPTPEPPDGPQAPDGPEPEPPDYDEPEPTEPTDECCCNVTIIVNCGRCG